MRSLLTFSLFLLLISSSLAQDYLRDVPKGHWAEDSVYELVRLGITGGYPDGTFRGKKNITRFEIASFLSKFAKSFNVSRGQNEKLVEELKSEVALIKYQKESAEKETKISGEFEPRIRQSLSASQEGRFDYRLKMSLTRTFDPASSVKITLDTMDAGFSANSIRYFATKLVDIEGKFKLGWLNYKINVGPGVVPHMDPDGLFPCENNTIYLRPKSAIEASGSTGKLDFSAAYVTRQVATSGKIGVHEFTAKLGYDFGKLAVYLRPHYLFVLDGPRDILADLGIEYKPSQNWNTKLMLSAGDFTAGQKGLYAKFSQELIDLGGRGTDILFRFDKVGSKYRMDDLDEYELVYLNNFDRLILDGTVDIGLKLKQRFWGSLSLEGKGDYVTTGDYKYGEAYPATYFLWELGLSYDISPRISAAAFYRSYHVPSGMAQFSDPVPKNSELIGVALKYAF